MNDRLGTLEVPTGGPGSSPGDVGAASDRPLVGDTGVGFPQAHILDTARADVASIDRWLANKHRVIWGEGFDISDPERRRKAALWLFDQMSDWVAST